VKTEILIATSRDQCQTRGALSTRGATLLVLNQIKMIKMEMIVKATQIPKKLYLRASKMKITTTCHKNQHQQLKMVVMPKIASAEQ